MGAPSNRTATLESQMIPMIQDVPGRTLRARVSDRERGAVPHVLGSHPAIVQAARLIRRNAPNPSGTPNQRGPREAQLNRPATALSSGHGPAAASLRLHRTMPAVEGGAATVRPA